MSTRTEPGRAAGDDLGRDGLERVVVGERREHDVGLRSQVSPGLGDGRAPGRERVGLRRRPVVDRQLVSAVQEALCDGRAHVAEADQPHGADAGRVRRALSSMNKRRTTAGQATST